MENLRNVLKWLALLQCVLLGVITIVSAQTPVCFREKDSDRIIKTGCKEFKGKHDAFPHYECPDSSGRLIPFDPKADPKNELEPLKGDDPLCKPEPTAKSDIPKGNGNEKAQSEKPPEKPASSESGKGDKP